MPYKCTAGRTSPDKLGNPSSRWRFLIFLGKLYASAVPETNMHPGKWMVGIWISFQEGLFSEATVSVRESIYQPKRAVQVLKGRNEFTKDERPSGVGSTPFPSSRLWPRYTGVLRDSPSRISGTKIYPAKRSRQNLSPRDERFNF